MDLSKCCQSCAMPLEQTEDMYGTNADGSKNTAYCCYCYQNGAFMADITIEEMAEFCVPHMVAASPDMDTKTAKQIMDQTLPLLKRWK